MENDLTPNVALTPDPNSPEAKIIAEEEKVTSGDEDKGTEATGNEPAQVDYKEKFGASTRENQRIMNEHKATQEKLREQEARLAELAQEKQEIEARLQDEKPEVYDTLKVSKELNELRKDVVLQKEKTAIEDYVANNPDAKQHKEALKSLGRANPSKSYDEVYNDFIKPVYESGIKDYEAKKLINKQTQPESGKDSADKSPIGVDDLSELNSKSLEERKRFFKSKGM